MFQSIFFNLSLPHFYPPTYGCIRVKYYGITLNALINLPKYFFFSLILHVSSTLNDSI